jgi:pimeloyl-ACP methyl ester carboxylesterase
MKLFAPGLFCFFLLIACSNDQAGGPIPSAALKDQSSTKTREEERAMEVAPVEGVSFRFIETNGIRMRIAEAGDNGPVVLLVHGWPESWYSWRHQIPMLVNAGYRVVVPEMRGYGQTEAPEPVQAYDIVELSADLVGVLDAVGVRQAHLVGHDWGAAVAAHAALLFPERCNSLVLMSVPYRGRAPSSPLEIWQQQFGDNFFYILYHNEEGGIAEKEYDADPNGIISRLYLSPDSPREPPEVTDPGRDAGGWIPRLGAAKELPDWLRQEDLDYIVNTFEESGFRGGVNYYRNFHRNWEITEHLSGVKIQMPTLFIAGQLDITILGAAEKELKQMMTPAMEDLRGVILVPKMGHWIQQEAPKEVNSALIEFLQSL